MVGVKFYRSLFVITSGGKVKEICKLIKNLKEVISWSKDTNSNSNEKFFKTYLCDTYSIEKGKKMLKERAAQTNQKDKEKALGKENIPLGKKQRKRTIEPTKKGNLKKAKESPEAVVTSTDDLVGKVVDHFCYLDDDAEEEEWNRGVVIEKTGSSKYLLCYHSCQDKLYTRDLNQDFKSNRIRLVSLRPRDLVGASVRHLLADDQSGEEIWWNAEIVDLDLTCKNQKDPIFFVLYHMDDMEYQVDEMGNTEHEYYEVTLMEDYHYNWLHIRCVDLTNKDINFDFQT